MFPAPPNFLGSADDTHTVISTCIAGVAIQVPLDVEDEMTETSNASESNVLSIHPGGKILFAETRNKNIRSHS